ncbi:DUF1893 domain-containing protein [Parasphaerochaeta coccoides]|uniref:DUF1893 domain-containing protein n=1 Tax=Parasphaerochaeta coccoides (strain ATCC BAA-1237 / DSM 17374 / SPN1) TaxID=760011 RepID=F4GIC0_PARC1|nr:DUF1893 domain-containing protein [Parasphaerochaeta coccoides]AEC01628.1 Domain of unknown function DUF1893 [Parasphaerochaeta coccoides DSM 17374]
MIKSSSSQKQGACDEALHLIETGTISCVVIQDDAIVHKADGRGVSPLLKLYDTAPEKLKDAVVIDKIIGKAAAMILVAGGVRKAYGQIMSAAAKKYLDAHSIETEYGRYVDVIENRYKTGMCPIEQSVIDSEDPLEGLEKIRKTVLTLIQAHAE